MPAPPLLAGIGLTHYLTLAAAVFCLGVLTMITKRNAIGILIGVELVLNAANLNLEEGNSFSNLAGVPSEEVSADRVDPFNPDNSYLICKLEGQDEVGSDCDWMVEDQMPLGAPPLDQDVIEEIRAWIFLGALPFPPVSVMDYSWGRVKSLYR